MSTIKEVAMEMVEHCEGVGKADQDTVAEVWLELAKIAALRNIATNLAAIDEHLRSQAVR